MSDYVHRDMQVTYSDEELANTDWTQLLEEINCEPWLEYPDFNWAAWNQGAVAPPGDR